MTHIFNNTTCHATKYGLKLSTSRYIQAPSHVPAPGQETALCRSRALSSYTSDVELLRAPTLKELQSMEYHGWTTTRYFHPLHLPLEASLKKRKTRINQWLFFYLIKLSTRLTYLCLHLPKSLLQELNEKSIQLWHMYDEYYKIYAKVVQLYLYILFLSQQSTRCPKTQKYCKLANFQKRPISDVKPKEMHKMCEEITAMRHCFHVESLKCSHGTNSAAETGFNQLAQQTKP